MVRALLFSLAAACGAAFFTLRAPSDQGNEEATAEAARGSTLVAPACDADGCGCPHVVVPASCCCMGRNGVEPERRELGTRLDPAVVEDVVAADAVRETGLPASTVESFHCSGGKRGHASAEMHVTPAAATRTTAIEIDPVRSWVSRDEPDPLDDLRVEPSTPPPRPGLASEPA